MLNTAQSVSLIYALRRNFENDRRRHAGDFPRFDINCGRFHCASLCQHETCFSNAIRIASLFSVTDSSDSMMLSSFFICSELHSEREIDDKWELSFILLHNSWECRLRCEMHADEEIPALSQSFTLRRKERDVRKLKLNAGFIESCCRACEGVLNFMDDGAGKLTRKTLTWGKCLWKSFCINYEQTFIYNLIISRFLWSSSDFAAWQETFLVEQIFFFSLLELRFLRFELIIHVDSIIVSLKRKFNGKCLGKSLSS